MLRLPFSLLSLLALSFFVRQTNAGTVLDPLPENSTTRFGAALVTLGDVNADGVPDLAVAAPFQDGDFVSTERSYGKPQNVGKIFILDGANFTLLNILTDPEFAVVQDLHFGGQLGSSLAVVGDLDGDGVNDLVAGVPHHVAEPESDESLKNAGKALVFSGQSGSLLLTLTDPTAEEDGKMGTAVAGIGDVDGDGTADLLVGAPGKDFGDDLSNVGLAYVYSGKTGSVIRTVNHPDDGGAEAGAAFGAAVANAGDIDRDGVIDITIGAPGEGHVYVFSGKTGNLLFTIVSPFAEALPSFGAAVAGGKDFNRDGKVDIVVGSPAREDQQGAAYIFNGNDGSLQRTLLPAVRQAFARFGASLCVSDDLTGDHRPDVAVGAPGQNVNGLPQAGAITIFNGRRGRVFQTLTSATPQPRSLFGTSVAAADFDGDRLATVIAGTPNQNATIDSGTGPVPHLEIGQIEIQP
ncbi:MAG: FG-GAP-like repeat-containing protein [Spartobacteria bacterium]